jgi:thiamine pyrophosphate-dependent acetolactate synthase large subunit-like protein
MPRQLEGIDYFQATDTNTLFRDVSLYTETISSPGQAPALIHQAIAAAYAGRGVAHLTVPVDVLTAKEALRVSPRSSRVQKSRPVKTILPRRPAASTEPAPS